MKTYDYYRNQGRDDAWLETNLAGLCGDVEMERSPQYDDKSDAYKVGDEYVLHICHSSDDVIESFGVDGEILETYVLNQ